MNLVKGIVHGAIISSLYLSYRYIGDTESFIASILLTGLLIRRLYLINNPR